MGASYHILVSLTILMMPLIAALSSLLVSKKRQYLGAYIACSTGLLGAIFSVYLLIQVWDIPVKQSVDWFTLGTHDFSFHIFIDVEAAFLLVIVTTISLLVHLFSLVYMKNDEGYQRYFATLGLFTFSMVGLIFTDNLLIIFMFWELVGLCSYLLIGHWLMKKSAAKAAKKAFLINRVGDIGFIIGLALCWWHFDTLSLTVISQQVSEVHLDSSAFTLLGLALFCGAVGKSAQFPLQVWLPDAMEGPTPVSALIHAATMVAAGVYLLARIFFLLSPTAFLVIALVGAITAFMGAIGALHQYDIKKVLAFSTISQLGYMVMAIGLQTKSAALFHLYTHAFFKAGLFLAAGSVIHSLHQAVDDHTTDVQDMRNMGGLRKMLPMTYLVFFICAMSLIGVPLFSGFLSKDAILMAVASKAIHEAGVYWVIAIMAFFTVLLTAYYMTRQILLVFFGSYRGKGVVREKSSTIIVVLVALAITSLGVVWSLNPFSLASVWIIEKLTLAPWQETFSASWIVWISIAFMSIGMVSGYKKFIDQSASTNFITLLSTNGWYMDIFYHQLIMPFILLVAKGCAWVERHIIDRCIDLLGLFGVIISHIMGWFDRAIVDGLVSASVIVVGKTGMVTKSIQNGKVQVYILWAIFSLLLILILAI